MFNNEVRISNVTRLVTQATDTTYMIRDTDDIINIDTSLGQGNITLYLPNILQSGYDRIPRKIFINDVSENASNANILIQALGGDMINNVVTITLNTDGISAELLVSSRDKWIASLNTDTNASGNSDKTFIYTQAIASTSWEVHHNLQKRAAVQVVNNAKEEIGAKVTWNSDNVVTVEFNTPQTGYVYCN